MTGITGVYFDLDDTLCTYWEAARAGLREAFALHAPDSTEALVKHWAAAFLELLPQIRTDRWYPVYLKSGEEPRTEVIRGAFHRLGVKDEELIRRVSHAYMTLRNQKLELFSDAIEVLSKLKQSYPLGLITNGPADIQRMEIDRLQIESYFDQIFIEGELGFGKPDPEVFVRAAQAMNKRPAELVFIGNSYEHDIRPAIEAGWKTIWVRRESDVPPSSIGFAVPKGQQELGLSDAAPEGRPEHSRGCNPRNETPPSGSPERGETTAPESLPPSAPAPDAEIHDLKELLTFLPPLS